MARITVLTPENILLLEEAFIRGYNVLEACKYASISKTAYYDYCKDNTELTDRIELLRSDLSIKAKNNIRLKIDDGDVDLSKWYLERRNKEEFSPRTDIKHENDKDNPINPTYAIVSERILAILEAGREIQNPTK